MPETTTTAAPPTAAPPANNPAALVASALAANAAAGDATPPPAGAAKPPETPPASAAAAQAKGPDDPNAGALAKLVQDAVAAATGPLKTELESLRSKETQREQQRQGEDAREAFIRDDLRGAMPALFRQLLPVTTDKAALNKVADAVYAEVGGLIKSSIQKGSLYVSQDGNIRFRDIGGAVREGGTPVTSPLNVTGAKQTPSELVQQGLQKLPAV